MIIFVDSEAAFDKVQHSFLGKSLNTLGVEGNFLSPIKGIYRKSIDIIIFKGEWLNAFFLLKSGIRQEYPFSVLPFIVLEILASAIRQEKKAFRLERTHRTLFANGMIMLCT